MENSVSGNKEKMDVLLEAVLFEQWIRFCWIAEDADEGYVVRIPEEALATIEKDFPHLQPLLLQLNNKPVDAALSCEAVLDYGRSQLGNSLDTVLASSDFQEQVGRFHLWLARRSEEPDLVCPSFAVWKKLADTTGETAEQPVSK